jgi:hypothetical protein
MTNKPKSVKRGSKAAAASQPKTTQSRARIQPAGSVTCAFYAADGREWACVDFPRDVFALVKRCAAKEGITLAQLFHNAVRNYDKATACQRAA